MKRYLMISAAAACLCSAVAACDDDDSSAYAAESSACVDRINEFRATLDLPPLSRWTDAESCANDEARQDSESGTAHGAYTKVACGFYTTPDGSVWAAQDFQ